MAGDIEETDIIIEAPELERINIPPGQRVRLMVRDEQREE